MAIAPDFSDRTYTTEVLTIEEESSEKILSILSNLLSDVVHEEVIENVDSGQIKIIHGYTAIHPEERPYHRVNKTRTVIRNNKKETIEIPRKKMIRGVGYYLYDIIISKNKNNVVISVPFHRLAETFFLKVDSALSGKNVLYEKMDLTNLIINLGQAGLIDIEKEDKKRKLQIGVTKCNLSYSDQKHRTTYLQKVAMTGTNLGLTETYKYLIRPVLEQKTTDLTVTPVLLGCSLFDNGTKKTSAVTDRHGNFKLWIGPGLTRMERLFSLLDAIDTIEGATSTTGNIPILQSKTIRNEEGA